MAVAVAARNARDNPHALHGPSMCCVAGAYTTARTVDGGSKVLKLTSHIERLARSTNLMTHVEVSVSEWCCAAIASRSCQRCAAPDHAGMDMVAPCRCLSCLVVKHPTTATMKAALWAWSHFVLICLCTSIPRDKCRCQVSMWRVFRCSQDGLMLNACMECAFCLPISTPLSSSSR